MSLRDKVRIWLGLDEFELRMHSETLEMVHGIVVNSNERFQKKVDDLEEQNKFLNMKLDMLMQGKQ